MGPRLVIDMNLSPEWVAVFKRHRISAVHWMTIGDPEATETTIMEWARTNGHVVFTHDLDFGTMLALTHADGPSVIQIRAQDIFPSHLEGLIIPVLQQYTPELLAGALVVIDELRTRVRVLPLGL